MNPGCLRSSAYHHLNKAGLDPASSVVPGYLDVAFVAFSAANASGKPPGGEGGIAMI
jgi:hypothetical protein